MKNQNLPTSVYRRAVTLVALVVLLFAAFAVRLYDVQVTDHETYRALAREHATLVLPIAAERGEILDRYGRPLVTNKTAYDVVVDPHWFPKENAAQNEAIAALCATLQECGDGWQDTLPIGHTAPFSFLPERAEGVAALQTALQLSASSTAQVCMETLITRYGLEDYPPLEQRWVAGVRHEMATRGFGVNDPYVFAVGVTKETAYGISENPDTFKGVTVQAATVRDYAAGATAVHLLGTVGPIYAEEYAALKARGYALNDTVGKSGAEAAFEPYLRGVSGRRVLRKNAEGVVVEATEEVPPVSGDTVVLTLNGTLQTAAAHALDTVIRDLRALPATSGGRFLNNGHDAASGAVVVLDVRDGGVLAAASWPWYDPATAYTALLNDPDRPLFNRALYGIFACGSVMKPTVALAALSEAVITPQTTVSCNGRYTRFSAAGLTLHCLGRHGRLRTANALQHSCNVFFYDMAERVGIDRMNRYAALCGLGEKTGIEVGEAGGVLAGPAFREAMGGVWSAADPAGAAIGQSDNLFTPIQLAAYAMTLANDGVRYTTHLFHSRLASDGRVKETYTPQIASRGMFSQEAVEAVREGMMLAATRGTAASYFRKAAYTVACKTGTAQVAQNHSDHGVFIAYAPVESPEVAIAVVVENGTSAASMQVARTVLDTYFGVSEG